MCLTKQEVQYPLPHKFKPVLGKSLDLDSSAKEISHILKSINCTGGELPPSYHLELINVQCNEVLDCN